MPDSYQPLDGRRRAVTIVFGAIVTIAIAAVISDVAFLDLIDRIDAGRNVTEAEATSADDRQQMIGIIQFLAYIVAAVVFIRWLHRAYQNVDVVAWKERRWGHGWAIGAWFVPILNLWRPKQIVNDVWRAGGRDAQDAEPGWLPALWWTAFLVSSFAWRAANASFDDDTLEGTRNGTIALIVSDGLDVIGAILAILLVRVATDRLDDRAATTPPPEPEGPSPDWQAPEQPAGAPV